ncbi:hypothetical protein [Streptomyces sp. NBC_00842]|uniref:hypothetical protein n=1 Tax=Streptomyces sp. NBC_00842 TaxID=2975848 RepID=UPI0038705BB8|nr:hypothetical protein OH821_07365 [Streptomyces sp. NBC_00842]
MSASSGGCAVGPTEQAGPGVIPRPSVTRRLSVGTPADGTQLLWERSGGRLSPDGAAAYERLLVEWAAAVRADVIEAA